MEDKINRCLCCGEPVKNKYCNVSCQNKHFWKGRKKSKETIEKRLHTIKNKWKTFKVSCYKCDVLFDVDEYNVSEPKKEKYYCSRSCANSRVWTKEDKKKKSDIAKQSDKVMEANKVIGIKKTIKYRDFSKIGYCLICGSVYNTNKTKKKTCSTRCHQNMLSNIQIEMYKNGENYVAGGTTEWLSVNTSNGLIKVQGSYEVRTCRILDTLKHNGEISEWEYTSDKIQYVDIKGKTRNYLLDFKVLDKDGSFYYIETKGFKRENDELKWTQTRRIGHKLLVWFNEDIIKEEEKLMSLKSL
jgi:hypothetical protein